MKLYDYWRSSCAYRLRIALNIKGIVPEREFINLLVGEQHDIEYKALNPLESVPMLEDNSAKIYQSLAAIEYLEERYPEPPLLPRDSPGRARVRSLAFTIACDIHPLNNLRVLQYIESEIGIGEKQRIDWYKHWITKGFEGIEKILEQNASSPYCHGGNPTIADICLVPQIFNAKRFACDLEPFPNILRIYGNCEDLTFFADAHPENQPDAVV